MSLHIPAPPSGLTPKKNLRRSAKDLVADILDRNQFIHVADLNLMEKNTILEAYPNSEGSNRILRESSSSQDTWIERVLRKLSQGKDPYRE